MANYTNLKNIIDQYITTNGQGDITGAILNDVLKSIVNSIGADFLFAGVAEPATNPGSPDQNVFYIATQGGNYIYFGGVIIPNGITIFKWNGSWTNHILFAGDGGVFDITAYNNNTKYADLTAALGTNGANVPQYLRKGGISVKFVQSSDNKYVQYRLLSQSFSTYIENWVAVGSEMTKAVNQHFRKSTNVCSGIIEYPGQTINSSGELVNNSSYNTSELFTIKGDTVYIGKYLVLLAYYDANKTFIRRADIITSSQFTTPANAAFARVCSYRPVSLWQLNEGSTLLDYEKPDALISENVVINTDKTFTKEGVAADAYALGTTRTMVPLKVIANAGIVSQLNVGEYAFNTSPNVNKVIYKVGPGSAENFDYIYILPNINCRYVYNGDIYKWNGTSLVNVTNNRGAIIVSASAGSGAAILELLNTDEYGMVVNGSGLTTLVRKKTETTYDLVDFDKNNAIYAWNGSLYKWDGEKLVDIFQVLNEDVDSIKLNLYGRILTGYEVITLQQGKTYVFTNNGNADVALNARVTSGGSNIPISSLLHPGDSVTYVAAQTTYYILVGSAGDKNVFVGEKIDNSLNMGPVCVLTSTLNSVNFLKGHTYKFINKDTECNLILKNGNTEVWKHLLMQPFEEDTITLSTNVDTVVIGSAGGRNIEVYDLDYLGGILSVHDRGMSFEVPVDFDLKEEIEDVSNDFSTFDFSDTIYQEDMLEQVYAHLDKLCALYPDYIKKYDPMASSDINQTVTIDGNDYTVVIRGMADVKSAMASKGFSDYPEYANGINSPITKTLPKGDGTTYEVTYDITPPYKTYVYMLKSEDASLVGDYVKRKIMLTGGVHANERISPVNLCIFAKKLCESTDANAFKLRAACDYLIIPYVNGYGCYHTRRTNAHWVDINRNYPTKNWTFLTDGLDDRNIWTCIYSGPNAGSEFETNLVMCVFNSFKPDFGIDHHNYAASVSQFYVEYGGSFRPVIMQAAVDVCKALQVKYASNFGNNYKLFLGSESIRLTRNATTDMFMRENTKNNYAITIEVSECVNYENGERVVSPTERFNSKVANIAYYTLKHQLMMYIKHFYKKYGMIKNM